MAEPRPFPPSPRRLALARASGLSAASPLLVGAAAAIAAIGATVVLGRAVAAKLGAWVAAACRAAASPDQAGADAGGAASAAALPGAGVGDVQRATDMQSAGDMQSAAGAVIDMRGAAAAVLELALPLVAAAALAAVVVHVAQTRTLWLPRRSLPGAPQLPRDGVARAALDLLSAAVITAVTVAWLWTTAPRLAALVHSPRAVGAALLALLATLAIAWLALGVVDAIVRRIQLTTALGMTRDEKREDDRLAAADPRWQSQRLSIMRGGGVSDAVARSAIVLLGDDVAVAIAWDPVRQPVPLRTATGRAARATQLLGLARRHHVAVHRDAALAARLVGSEGPVPDADWPRLAELIAAVRSR